MLFLWKKTLFENLAPFKRVGWDFDKTLVDHPRSAEFQRFIDDNPYDQQHFIVTMRSHGMENHIFTLLEECDSGLGKGHFIKVINASNETYEGKPKLILPGDDHEYFMWKGETCANNGIEVLIDDEPHTSQRGCERHGIIFIHPDNLR